MPIRKDLQNAPEKKRRARRGNMERRPLIGICGGQNEEKTRVMIGKRYTQEILRAGGLPVLLPYTTDKAAIDDILAHVDGLLLAGGEDVHPSRFGEELLPCCGAIDEERDGFELLITQRALELRMPIFGICRGIQVLAVAMGATLFQDIESQLGILKEKHKQTMPFDDPVHTVRFKEGGLFERITGTQLMPTNSMHHQAIKEAGDRIKIEGITMDGIIEAISALDNEAVFGVQFHPEYLADYSDFAARMFSYFVEQAKQYSKE